MVQLKFELQKLPIKTSIFRLAERLRLAPAIAGLSLLAMTVPALSQTSSTVTLESSNGSMAIMGELVDIDAENYTIRGPLGLFTVPRIGVLCKGDRCPGTETETSAPSSLQVDLISIDDETRISGELVDIEEKHYVIRNSLGEFRVTISNVNCIGGACPVIDIYDPEVTIFGASPKVTLLLADLLKGYSQETGQRIEVDEVNETTRSLRVFAADSQELVANINLSVNSQQNAVGALSDNTADLLVYEELQIGSQSGGSDSIVQTALAFDGQVVVSNPDNPVRDLSIAEIDQIWNGELKSWRTLGGGDFPITLHMVEDGADTIGWLTGLRASSTPGVVTHSTEEQVIDAINADRNALGVVHWAAADQAHANMLAVRKVCGLTAEPSKFGIRTQHYPFTQPIFSYGQKTGMHPFAQSFLEWTQTAAAEAYISDKGYTAGQLQRTKVQDMGVAVVHTAAVEPDFDGVEFASMMRELRSADRLSMTFTFLTGSTVLDEASILNVKDLAKRLRGSEFANQEILLVGFADSTGPADRNTTLSERRAETVREVLALEFNDAERADLNLLQMGFGEQMPVDCNSTDNGRANNRRVEVWARVQN
ncbi:MAG: phosphate ABC transporter substrate-binding/OmpA family protein [Sulfitobacter sp.]